MSQLEPSHLLHTHAHTSTYIKYHCHYHHAEIYEDRKIVLWYKISFESHEAVGFPQSGEFSALSAKHPPSAQTATGLAEHIYACK